MHPKRGTDLDDIVNSTKIVQPVSAEVSAEFNAKDGNHLHIANSAWHASNTDVLYSNGYGEIARVYLYQEAMQEKFIRIVRTTK